MENKQIAYRRMQNQQIINNKSETPYDVVKKLGAIQAQNYRQALWAIGSRTTDSNLAKIEQSISEGKIVLTWAMRGTMHVVSAEDVHWMLSILSPRNLRKGEGILKKLEFTPNEVSQSEKMIYNALKENGRMKRQDVMKLLEDQKIMTSNGRGYHLLWYLAQTGLICLGPIDDKQQTFVLLDEWIKEPTRLTTQNALAVIAKRYYSSHGPATLKDFAWWTGLTMKTAKEGVDRARGHLKSEVINGIQYWTSRDEPGEIKEQKMATLLPGYDEYLLGYKDRDAVLKEEYASLLVPGRNAVYSPMLVLDGEIAGTWKQEIKKGELHLSISPFFEIEKKMNIFDSAEEYGKFVDLPISRVIIQSEN